MRKFGLIGFPLKFSFSPGYFKDKYEKENINDAKYDLYPLSDIAEVTKLLDGSMNGFNVTIPYKKDVIKYLDELDPVSKAIGAVNTVRIIDGKSKGFNTDVYGFEESLKNCFTRSTPAKALILGDGGATRAVQYVLDKLSITHQTVSRKEGFLNYKDLTEAIINDHKLIINTTPLGMSPKEDTCPNIPYEHLGADHILYDLVYVPEKTLFLQKGETQGAVIKNGLEMLHLQAEKSWEYWNEPLKIGSIEDESIKDESISNVPVSNMSVKNLPLRNASKRDVVDFSNTKIAFANKNNKALKKSYRLFQMMNKPALVSLGSSIGALAVKLKLPFTKSIVKSTIFEQFCGGETLLESQDTIDDLAELNCVSILDYGAESKSSKEELDQVVQEVFSAIEFASTNASVPVVSIKMTSLVANEILIKKDAKEILDESEQQQYKELCDRLEKICNRASSKAVAVFVDAEESWMQNTIDELTIEMMAKYNTARVIVYNTYQMYRHDRLQALQADFAEAQMKGYILGAKIVRGAYMEKERKRAEAQNYPSPIQKDKAATDHDYDEAIRFCVDNYERLASCAATHNLDSNYLQANLIAERGIRKDHYHLNFCQLMGMSDYITFNLAKGGYNVAKYVVYGSVQDVVPYLIRRAKENTSIMGEASREFSLIKKEIDRRKLD